MDVNAMIRELRRILTPPPSTLKDKDPFEPLSQALELVFSQASEISWLGLYLVSRKRQEIVLGPFFGRVRVEVRLPIASVSQDPGLWAQDSVLGYNGIRNDQWLGCIFAQTRSLNPSPELGRMIESLGYMVTPWLVDCDREDPFS